MVKHIKLKKGSRSRFNLRFNINDDTNLCRSL